MVAGVGVLAVIVTALWERRVAHPRIPPALFAYRAFTVMNLATLVVYAAFAASMVFVALFLQVTGGWDPLAAGAATMPISIVMFFLAGRFGGWANRLGAVRLMVGGMLVVAIAFALYALLPDHPDYLTQLGPIVLLQGLGMSMLVAPLTGTVLGAVPDASAGVASGINNAVSRTGGLLAVAALPMLVGLGERDYAVASHVSHAFHAAMGICAGLVALGALNTWIGLGGRDVTPDQA